MSHYQSSARIKRRIVQLLLAACILYLVGVFALHVFRAAKESYTKRQVYNSIRDMVKQIRLPEWAPSEKIAEAVQTAPVTLPENSENTKQYPRRSWAIWLTGEDFKSVPHIQHAYGQGAVYSSVSIDRTPIEYIVYAEIKKYAQEEHEFEQYRETGVYDQVKKTGNKETKTIWAYSLRVRAFDVKTGQMIACEELAPGPLPTLSSGTYILNQFSPTKGSLITPEEISFRVMGRVGGWFNDNCLEPAPVTDSEAEQMPAVMPRPSILHNHIFIVVMVGVILAIVLVQGV
jgi:hypothetical protein